MKFELIYKEVRCPVFKQLYHKDSFKERKKKEKKEGKKERWYWDK